MKPSPTLGRIFAATLIGVAVAGAALFYTLFAAWRGSLLETSGELRDAAARRAAASVASYLGLARGALDHIDARIHAGVIDAGDEASIEAGLFGALLDTPRLAEIAFTRARRLGFDDEGRPLLAPEGRAQVSVYRGGEDAEQLTTRRVYRSAGRFVVDERRRPRGSRQLSAGRERRLAQDVEDPTDHPTFSTTAWSGHEDDVLWTDLHYAQSDSQRPEPERRVVLSVLKAVFDSDVGFLGVLRVSVLATGIEAELARIHVHPGDPADPARLFLCDGQGRLLSRLDPRDRIVDDGGDLRLSPANAPAEIRAALGSPALRELATHGEEATSTLEVGGRRFLVSFLALEGTRDWRVGVVVPEAYYLSDVEQERGRVLGRALAVLAALGLLGLLTLRSVRRGLGQIVGSARRMREFDFAATPARSPFHDVSDVIQSLELAKTALRAMSRYVPVDLVRQLYANGREPVLGGELRDVTLMFTDIESFTSLAERLSPDELAERLGRYLAALTGEVHANDGIVDKYIGDAVMALWNAARETPDQDERACRAALACVAASRAQGLATRCGLHRDRVMVGHFGAPDRMSFTALGDGVNLASRLEGLNKQYGTAILASESVQRTAAARFAFRLVDAVAVKGKAQGTRVYELLGEAPVEPARLELVRRYERALAAYFSRRFDDALTLLDPLADSDAPSRALAKRCRDLRMQPPPADWDGVYVAQEK